MASTIKDLFRKQREEWLDKARQTAKRLLAVHSSVTIEDVLEHCPRPTYIHRNITGNVFRDEAFVPFGFAHSRRRASHGRIIRRWVLAEEWQPKGE